MADVKNMHKAQATFRALRQALDAQNWRYNADEEMLALETGAEGDGLPIQLVLRVDPDRMLLMALGKIPFVVSEDKRIDMALAICAVNDFMVNGSFDLDVATGKLYFRLTNTLEGVQPSDELFYYMLFCACKTIDEYSNTFLMLDKGLLSLEQFLNSL